MPNTVTQVQNSIKVEPLIKMALENIKMSIQENMRSHKRNASGKTISPQYLYTRTTGASGELYGKQSMMALETGRKKGKIPYGFSYMLAVWIKDKGISVYNTGKTEEQKRETAGYFMARAIAARGTTLHRRGGFDDIYSSAIERNVKALNDEIGVQASSFITYINQQYANTNKK